MSDDEEEDEDEREPKGLTFVISDQILGIAMRDVGDEGDGVVIDRLKADSQAAALGVPIGGRIMSINGEVAESIRPLLAAQLKSATRPTTLHIEPPEVVRSRVVTKAEANAIAI